MGVPLVALGVRPPQQPEDVLTSYAKALNIKRIIQQQPVIEAQLEAEKQQNTLRGLQIQQTQKQIDDQRLVQEAVLANVKPQGTTATTGLTPAVQKAPGAASAAPAEEETPEESPGGTTPTGGQRFTAQNVASQVATPAAPAQPAAAQPTETAPAMPDHTGVVDYLTRKGRPDLAAAYIKPLLQQHKDEVETTEKTIKNAQTNLELASQAVSKTTDQASWDSAIAAMKNLGLNTSMVPRAYSQTAKDQVMAMGMKATERLKAAEDEHKNLMEGVKNYGVTAQYAGALLYDAKDAADAEAKIAQLKTVPGMDPKGADAALAAWKSGDAQAALNVGRTPEEISKSQEEEAREARRQQHEDNRERLQQMREDHQEKMLNLREDARSRREVTAQQLTALDNSINDQTLKVKQESDRRRDRIDADPKLDGPTKESRKAQVNEEEQTQYTLIQRKYSQALTRMGQTPATPAPGAPKAAAPAAAAPAVTSIPKATAPPAAGEQTATGPGGQKLVLRNNQWVLWQPPK